MVRRFSSADNLAVAQVIRTVMPEFGASGPGFSINDPEVDAMYEAYDSPQSEFFVVTRDDVVMGCGGVAPLAHGNPGTCELRKMYFLSEVRGLGAGRELLTLCLHRATNSASPTATSRHWGRCTPRTGSTSAQGSSGSPAPSVRPVTSSATPFTGSISPHPDHPLSNRRTLARQRYFPRAEKSPPLTCDLYSGPSVPPQPSPGHRWTDRGFHLSVEVVVPPRT